MLERGIQKHGTGLLQGALVLLLLIASAFTPSSRLGVQLDSLATPSAESNGSWLSMTEVPATEVSLPQTPTALQALVQLKLSVTVALIAVTAAILAGVRMQSPGPLFLIPIPPPGLHQRSRLHAYLN